MLHIDRDAVEAALRHHLGGEAGGIASQPLTTTLPAAQTSLTLFAIRSFPVSVLIIG
jgi:Arc/MetJ family transcription regulator